jgi:ABC-type ATPase with predicted acetyltransferase domain
LRVLETTASELNTRVEDLIEEIDQIAADPSKISELPPEKYWAFKAVLRLPRPYFLKGLDEESHNYIKRNTSRTQERQEIRKIRGCRIQLESLEISCQYDIPQSDHTRLILDSFGLTGDLLSYSLLGPMDVQASGGNIIFISGPSGSGKSVLLKALDIENSNETLNVKMRNFSKPADFSVSWMKEIESDLPIIEYLAQKTSIDHALAAMNSCGLAEAFTYIKPYRLLSRGQKYRARLAELLLSESSVWLVDEFCADLDPLSAQIVAYNFRRHVMRSQIIAFVAAANNHHFLSALRPARVIDLGHGGSHRVLGYREYLNEFDQNYAR